jgi:hypothetical protein
MNFEKADFTKILEKTLDEFKELYKLNPNLDFAISIQAKNLILLCDINRIKQVINNLIHNAVKFSESGLIQISITNEKLDNTVYEIYYDNDDNDDDFCASYIFDDFDSFYSSTKTNFNGITKISFKNALELIAKQKKTNLLFGEIDIDDKFVTDSLEKMSDKNDEDTGIFGTNYLADLREGKQPSSSSKVSFRTEMYLYIHIYKCRKPYTNLFCIFLVSLWYSSLLYTYHIKIKECLSTKRTN